MACRTAYLTLSNTSRSLAQSFSARSSRDRWLFTGSLAYASSIASSSASSSKLPQREPLLQDQPPVVVPSLDVASPQIAARPPRPPRAEKPKPTLRATKAAISLV